MIVLEVFEIKGTIMDYAINYVKEKREVSSRDVFFTKVIIRIMKIQKNNAKYNEANEAIGISIGSYTTVTALKYVIILTNDVMKTNIRNSQLDYTSHVAGLDLSDRIISFDVLGGL